MHESGFEWVSHLAIEANKNSTEKRWWAMRISSPGKIAFCHTKISHLDHDTWEERSENAYLCEHLANSQQYLHEFKVIAEIMISDKKFEILLMISIFLI